MASQRRNILMLMDNASSRKIPTIPLEKLHGLDAFRLSNVLISFLPPNTTSEVQPLDAGILAALKQRYRMRLLQWYLSQYETADDSVNLAKLVPGVKQAILWCVAAMEQISAQTTSNCWRHTGILPPTMSADIASNDERERHRDNAAASELSDLINDLNLGSDALTAEEYEQFPGEQEVQIYVLFAQYVLTETHQCRWNAN